MVWFWELCFYSLSQNYLFKEQKDLWVSSSFQSQTAAEQQQHCGSYVATLFTQGLYKKSWEIIGLSLKFRYINISSIILKIKVRNLLFKTLRTAHQTHTLITPTTHGDDEAHKSDPVTYKLKALTVCIKEVTYDTNLICLLPGHHDVFTQQMHLVLCNSVNLF